jgi:anti-sigma regulatory factor (Ser/Thr protein kinase)
MAHALESSPRARPDGFVHEAFFYDGDEAFLAETVPFLADGAAAGDPMMVALPPAKLDLLRTALGERDSARVRWVDMTALGVNPARIIPAWRAFADEHSGGGAVLRGIGEPAWPGRSGAEFAECERHEALLNLAFADAGPFLLLCPYDTAGLAPAVVEGARRTHPLLVDGGRRGASNRYVDLDRVAQPFDAPLSDPPRRAAMFSFGDAALPEVRQFLRDQLSGVVGGVRLEELVVAVNELATNAVHHGGGHGLLRVWSEPGAVVCEVKDRGLIRDPLVGRRLPDQSSERGRGVWMVNHLCELVQVRSGPSGTVVRVHLRTGA